LKDQLSFNITALHRLQDFTPDAIVLQKLEILSNLFIVFACYICGLKDLTLEPLLWNPANVSDCCFGRFCLLCKNLWGNQKPLRKAEAVCNLEKKGALSRSVAVCTERLQTDL